MHAYPWRQSVGRTDLHTYVRTSPRSFWPLGREKESVHTYMSALSIYCVWIHLLDPSSSPSRTTLMRCVYTLMQLTHSIPLLLSIRTHVWAGTSHIRIVSEWVSAIMVAQLTSWKENRSCCYELFDYDETIFWDRTTITSALANRACSYSQLLR